MCSRGLSRSPCLHEVSSRTRLLEKRFAGFYSLLSPRSPPPLLLFSRAFNPFNAQALRLTPAPARTRVLRCVRRRGIMLCKRRAGSLCSLFLRAS